MFIENSSRMGNGKGELAQMSTEKFKRIDKLRMKIIKEKAKKGNILRHGFRYPEKGKIKSSRSRKTQ